MQVIQIHMAMQETEHGGELPESAPVMYYLYALVDFLNQPWHIYCTHLQVTPSAANIQSLFATSN